MKLTETEQRELERLLAKQATADEVAPGLVAAAGFGVSYGVPAYSASGDLLPFDCVPLTGGDEHVSWELPNPLGGRWR